MAFSALRSLHGARSGRNALSPRALERLVARSCPASQRRWAGRGPRQIFYPETSDAVKTEKPFYVTTPIFYVNAAPHIGHLYSMVLADVIKRWQQVKGREAFLSTGTDEHGMKIQQAAKKQEVTPKELCDANSLKFMQLTDEGTISHDTFIRTTDEDHKIAVEQFWAQLKFSLPKSLGLYESKHKGWYSVDDECFYPEDMIEPAIHPQTGKRQVVSSETKSVVEWIEEETYVFPLTKYKDQLLKFYDDNPDWIQPRHRMNEVRDWVENHLEDLSVTRPFSRLQWGIRDPNDPKHTIYVWVDALINYLTISGYGQSWHRPTEVDANKENLWPADVHVVGKDIIRFHAIYWPALLMALGLPLPKKILCHNHWTMSNRKMSKSVGNVVSPTFAVQRWGTDALRYFLMRNGSLQKDTDYSNDVIYAMYIKDLQANLGNLYYRLYRASRTPSWSTRDSVETFTLGEIEKNRMLEDPRRPATHYSQLETVINEVPRQVQEQMDNNEISAAIGHIYTLLAETNRYISDTEPWKIVKDRRPEGWIKKNWIIFNCAEALRIATILLQPIMPTKTNELLNGMKVDPSKRTMEYAKYGADTTYGTSTEEVMALGRVNAWETVFPPVPPGELTDEEVKQELGGLLAKRGRHRPTAVAEYIALEARMGTEAVAKMREEQKPKGTQITGERRI